MFTSFNFICVVNLLFIFCVHGTISLEEGDECPLKDGSQGVCKFIVHCLPALELLKKGVLPENHCGFKGTQSIVCCTDTSNVKETTPITIEPMSTTSAPPGVNEPKVVTTVKHTDRIPGEISKQKCKEYAKYVINRNEAPTLSVVSHYSNTFECAFEKLKLIVGGTLASRQEFPHMALIGYQTGKEILWGCGGSLISESYILTAAHCLRSRQQGPAKFVKLGITNQTDSTNLQEIRVSEIIFCPQYEHTKYHDIGLLKLSRNADLNTYVRPACLHTERNIPYKNAIAAGWGKIRFTSESGTRDLFKVVLEFFNVQKCNKTYKTKILEDDSLLMNGIVEDLMICAGSSKEIRDTCQGDSGGPLQIYHEDTEDIKCMYDIVGVTSFGKSCGLAKNIPGVYTRVSAYIKWIEDIVWSE